jgi:glycosyltransferase involved in cell wall biosynthesis
VRVAILTYLADHGAFATIAHNITKGLTGLDVQVDVLYIAGPDPHVIAKDYPDGSRLVRLGGRARACTPSVVRYLRAQRPDALISLGWILHPGAVSAVVIARTRTPLILNEQSCLSYKTRVEHRTQIGLRFLDRLARVIYPRASIVTGASRAIIEDLVNEIGIDPSRTPLRVVSNSVDAKMVVQLSTFSNHVVREGTVFINVARHARQKNLPLLLKAFSMYLAQGNEGTLVLLGEGPDSATLIELARDLGVAERVRFKGQVANPFPHVAAATAFILSSEEEGFGLVLVEAMALGVPVISTDCPGGPRDILQDGRAGVLVPSNDVQALASAMAQLSHDKDLRLRLADAGRERAADYDPSKIGRQWLEIVREATATRSV